MKLAQKVIPVPIEEEMKDSYLDYAMSVIISRALPDIKDGLKPVHRRILYAMDNLNLYPDRPYKKSAAVVGDVIAKYHPHGDAAVYDALVRLAQDFSMRYPLIDGHGNFGSVDGDPPAAYRYTEVRLAPMALQFLDDLEKETVDFRPNFDNSLQEPCILPAKLPTLLLNGASGIAVGMATNIPPHNLQELIDGIIKVIDEPYINDEELFNIIRGPDFPTGGIILGQKGIINSYLTGRGSITIRAKTHLEEKKGKKVSIIVTEIPYQVNKSRLIEQIAEQVREKKIVGISDLRDESDRKGMRIVIELKSDTNPQIVLNQLFKHTALQSNFGVILLALVDGQPQILTLREMIDLYISHRENVVTRRTNYELRKAKEKAHLLEGFQVALDHIDEVIETIRGSATPTQAKQALMDRFGLSEAQAQGILELRLQRLTGMERQKIQDDYRELIQKIAYLEEILASRRRILQVIKEELQEIREKFGDKRKTEIIAEEPTDFETEDLIHEEDMAITITHGGYIKRLTTDAYRSQKRGGRGIQGLSMKAEDFVEHFFVASTHHYLLFFTNKGKVYRLKVHEIPEASRTAKGTAIANLVNMPGDERIAAIFPVKTFDSSLYLFMATQNGLVKKTPLVDFANITRAGIRCIILEEGNKLVGVELTDGSQEIILGTKNGLVIHFREKDVRSMGRAAKGVRGIQLRKDDYVVALDNLRDRKYLLTVTSRGYGKKTLVSLYTLHRRGGKGMKNIKVNPRNGYVIGLKAVNEEDEIMLVTKDGLVIRMNISAISQMGRDVQGVKLINLYPEDEVTAVAHLPADIGEELEKEGQSGGKG